MAVPTTNPTANYGLGRNPSKNKRFSWGKIPTKHNFLSQKKGKQTTNYAKLNSSKFMNLHLETLLNPLCLQRSKCAALGDHSFNNHTI